MSRYVTRARRQASKICGLKRGSVAFRTASALTSRDQADDRVLVRGVEPRRAEAVVLAEPVDNGLRARGVEVGEHDPLEERAALRDGGKGRADTTGSDDEDSHGGPVVPDRAVRGVGGRRGLQLSAVMQGVTLTSDFTERRSAVSVSVTEHKQFIGGEWVESSSGETMEVLNPATGEVIAEVPRATAEDVARAVEAAKSAWATWQLKTPKDRMELLLALADVIDENAEELARLESHERRQAVVGREGRAAGDVGLPALLRRRRAEPRGEVGRGVRRGLHVDDPARAARDRRGNLPLELPAVHGRSGSSARRSPPGTCRSSSPPSRRR